MSSNWSALPWYAPRKWLYSIIYVIIKKQIVVIVQAKEKTLGQRLHCDSTAVTKE